MKITIQQRRFLIVWVAVNAFALLVNVAKIEGRIKDGGTFYVNGQEISDSKVICLFMNAQEDVNNKPTFYPFTSNFTRVLYYSHQEPYEGMYWRVERGFLGIFNDYTYLEFFVYVLLGFAIIYLPKFWHQE